MIVLGLALGANAAWMLANPLGWYNAIPGVAATGPANQHFIRDIGCAYLVCVIALFWLAVAEKTAWPAAMAAGGFLVLHALVHLWDALAGRESAHQLLADLPGVFLPGILAIWLAWPASRAAHFSRLSSRAPSGARDLHFPPQPKEKE
jgi:hypothetical protein